LTNSTSSLSGGLPTIAERQKPQKNTRELVTLEVILSTSSRFTSSRRRS
jgi:hypothetical protein